MLRSWYTKYGVRMPVADGLEPCVCHGKVQVLLPCMPPLLPAVDKVPCCVYLPVRPQPTRHSMPRMNRSRRLSTLSSANLQEWPVPGVCVAQESSAGPARDLLSMHVALFCIRACMLDVHLARKLTTARDWVFKHA